MTNQKTTPAAKGDAGVSEPAQAPVKTKFHFYSRHQRYSILLDKPKVATNGRVIEPGRKIKFTSGSFTTDDAQLARRLRELRGFGRDFHEVDGTKIERAVKPAAA